MMTKTAPAKVNLTLEVLGRRPDGYHALRSLVVFADVGDRLTAEFPSADQSHGGRQGRLGPTPEGVRLDVYGPFGGAIEGENLLTRVVGAWAEAFPGAPLPATLALEKNLPVAAGIGGGSSDAAALLRILMQARMPDGSPASRTFSPPAAQPALIALAASLGADIPVCLLARPAMMEGIGEIVTPVARLPDLPAVLVNPGIAVPTGQIFRELAAPPLSDDAETSSCDAAESAFVPPSLATVEDVAEWAGTRTNDLQSPALRVAPGMAEVEQALHGSPEVQPLLVRMSGSGATWFALCGTADEAKQLANAITARHPGWWVVATTLEGCG